MNFAGVRAVADHMMPMFEAIGFDARWEDGAAFGRAGLASRNVLYGGERDFLRTECNLGLS
jgi:hypothetical protein